VRLEELGQLKNPMTSSGIEYAVYWNSGASRLASRMGYGFFYWFLRINAKKLLSSSITGIIWQWNVYWQILI
jgi:hypothetical protein